MYFGNVKTYAFNFMTKALLLSGEMLVFYMLHKFISQCAELTGTLLQKIL